MERVFKEKLSRVASRLQQVFIRISLEIKRIASVINLENESIESKKTFYLLSLMLLISLALLSPDKLPQAFSPAQAETAILEKTQELLKIIKKMAP